MFLFQFSFIFLELETFQQTKAGKSPSTEFLFFKKIFNHIVFFVTFSCVFLEVNFDLSRTGETTDFLKIGWVITTEIALVGLCISLLSFYKAIKGQIFKACETPAHPITFRLVILALLPHWSNTFVIREVRLFWKIN